VSEASATFVLQKELFASILAGILLGWAMLSVVGYSFYFDKGISSHK
jgi:F0F1-type ATP synthase assembly protein I